VEVMGPDEPWISCSPNQWLGDISGQELARRLSTRDRVRENTMVSTHGHMSPPEAYRGEKRVTVKPLNHASMSRVLIPFEYVKSKNCVWKGKGDNRSNHLMPLVQILCVHAMLGERRQITNSKAHHSK
jgi:hypothetical protein